MKQLRSWIWIYLLSSGITHAEILSAGTAPWRPFAFYDEQHQLKGIAVDIARELAQRTHNQLQLELYPAKRLNQLFDTRQLDINIADSPLWNPQPTPTQIRFTRRYMEIREYLYFARDHGSKARSVDELKDLDIGLILGYAYPKLEPLFVSGQLRKHEYADEATLLKLLQRHRLDAIVMDEVLFNHLVQQNPQLAHQYQQGLQLSTAPLALKLHNVNDKLMHELDEALLQMEQEQVIQQIIQRYIGPDSSAGSH